MLIWLHLVVETPNAARLQRREVWSGTVPWTYAVATAMLPGDTINLGAYAPVVTQRGFTVREEAGRWERAGTLDAFTVHCRLVIDRRWGSFHRVAKRVRLKMIEHDAWDSKPPKTRR